MNINNSYPHPVLGNSNDFTLNDFKLNIRTAEQDFMYRYLCVFDMGVVHDDIEKLINKNQIEYVVQVYCQRTFFRKIFRGNEKSIQFDIPIEHIRGRIEFVGFLIAKDDIENYNPEGLNEDYFVNAKYKICSGDVLGITNKTVDFIEPKYKKPLKSSTKSIIKFSPSKEIKAHYKVRSWAEDQIDVFVPKKMYSLLKKKQYQHIHVQGLYLPIIADALSKIHDREDSELNDLKWYYVINKEFNNLGIDQDEDNYYKAQILLKKPLKKYIEKINNIDELITDE